MKFWTLVFATVFGYSVSGGGAGKGSLDDFPINP
jgi:hypothetical protein